MLLVGSWVVFSGDIGPVIWSVVIDTLLLTPFVTPHEHPLFHRWGLVRGLRLFLGVSGLGVVLRLGNVWAWGFRLLRVIDF